MIEVPVLLFVTWTVATDHWRDANLILSLMVSILWVITLVLLGIVGARAFTSERAARTLDVLLTTPLSSRSIVLQKATVLRRTARILMIPFVSCYLFKAFLWNWVAPSHFLQGAPGWIYLLGFTSLMVVYLRLIGWIALFMGLKVKKPARAVLATLGLLLVWQGAPLVLLSNDATVFLASIVSPASLVVFLEINQWRHLTVLGILLVVILNGLFHAFLLGQVRKHCLLRADRYLGRSAAEIAGTE